MNEKLSITWVIPLCILAPYFPYCSHMQHTTVFSLAVAATPPPPTPSRVELTTVDPSPVQAGDNH